MDVGGKSALQCTLCRRGCLIKDGEVGFCRTRRNAHGQLESVVYGRLAALESRPIEIKPFFHFYPGSTALTYCCYSCNLRCRWCQNWHLSRTDPLSVQAEYVSPQDLVDMALHLGDRGLCCSFTEPTLLHEYNLATFSLAKAAGLYTCYVSNGYMTIGTLRELHKAGLDAIKIDVKGDAEVYREYCAAPDGEKVWETAAAAKEIGLHVEIVNLVVTDVNDSERALRYVIQSHLQAVGPETPLHFTRYFPAYQMHAPPTPIPTLEHAYRLARQAGLTYVYLGNVPGHPAENTYCPSCGQLLIERSGYRMRRNLLTPSKQCPSCGCKIPCVG
ncbi:MAG: AmmeMemoRadiSam system radical SAM enzyme [Anaerolineae bacterium]